MRRVITTVVLALAIAGALLAATAQADFPYGHGPNFDPKDPTTYAADKTTPAPNDLGGNDWKYAGTPEPDNHPVNEEPWEQFGIRGAHVFDAAPSAMTPSTTDDAWNVTTGRPDVAIAEFDSGVEWNDPGLVIDLRYKTKLNKGELPVPDHTGPNLIPSDPSIDCTSYKTVYDANGDGIFNLKDYACDKNIDLTDPRRAGPPGMFTPEDITIAFSNGDDADSNGFKDDIAGWDFLDDDNDPFDDVQYGHGSGEARGGAGEVNNGGNSSPCPNCMIAPFRVGDSFIADANRFAQATMYAVDNNFQIVQEALGTLNNTRFARQAIDYAYKHGVPIIASAADEAAQHHNYVSSLPHTIVVNSVNKYPTEHPQFPDSAPGPFGGLGAEVPVEEPKSYLTFNGCTNFSSKITVSIPSSSCSSNATEVAGGIAGLIYSAALNARDKGKLQANSNCHLVNGQQCPISANEMRQLIATGSFDGQTMVDDVNFTSSSANPALPEPPAQVCGAAHPPHCTDPNGALQADVEATRPIVSPPDSRSYPARKGPDQFYGYGRVNAFRSTMEVSQGHVLPEVEITSPDWFDQLDPDKAKADVKAQVWARGAKYTCQVLVAPGSYPANDTVPTGDFEALSGTQIPTKGCDGSTEHTDPIDGVVASIDIPALKTRFPTDATGTSFRGRESGTDGAQTSNGRPNTEPYGVTIRVVATTVADPKATGDDRRNVYLHRDQDMMNGFPKRLLSDGASSPAFADLDGDNKNELVFGTGDGVVHAMKPDGSELPGWPVHTDALPVHEGSGFAHGEVDHPYGAILASIAVGDLDRDGSPEVVAADYEGKVYAWHADGSLDWQKEANVKFSGRPLDPFVNVRGATGQGHWNRTGHGFIGSPVLANLDGVNGGPLDVVIGNEDRHVYAWGPDGADINGFPVLVVDHDKVQSIDPTTHRVTYNLSKTAGNDPGSDIYKGQLETDQGAIIDTPAVGDLTGDGKPEIVIGTNDQYKAGAGDEGDSNTTGSQSYQALGQTGLLSGGNTRLYALKNTGDVDHDPMTPDWSAWAHPVKLALLQTGLLPVVGEGVTGSPVIGPVDCGANGGAGPKVGAIPNNGFGYILNKDGSSCLGESGGKYKTLQTDTGTGGPSGQQDRPNFPAVGHPAFGNFAGGVSFLAPVTGILRALDVVFPEYQTGSQDFVAAWNPSSGDYRTGFPARTNDLQFLTGPSVADIDGQAGEEVLEGSAHLDLQAYNSNGAPVSTAWPKLMSGWVVPNPLIGSFGTIDTDASAHKRVVEMTRDGHLFAYNTAAPSCSPSSWPRFHHDLANSGDYDRDAIDPGKPTALAYSSLGLSFKAPGDDLMCGQLVPNQADPTKGARYELRESDTPLTGKTFDQGDPIPGMPPPKAPGQTDAIALGGGLKKYLALRAVDDQGNVGPVAVVATGAGGGGGGGGGNGGGGDGGGGNGGGGNGGGGNGGGGNGNNNGGNNGGGGTSGKTACGDTKRPRSSIARHGLKKTKKGLKIRGRTGDHGCASLPSRNRLLATISLARKTGKKCRFLTASGKFSKKRSCRKPSLIVMSGSYSLVTHKLSWTFHTPKLKPGKYFVDVRGVDQSGNVESKKTHRNHKAFRVRRHRH